MEISFEIILKQDCVKTFVFKFKNKKFKPSLRAYLNFVSMLIQACKFQRKTFQLGNESSQISKKIDLLKTLRSFDNFVSKSWL